MQLIDSGLLLLNSFQLLLVNLYHFLHIGQLLHHHSELILHHRHRALLNLGLLQDDGYGFVEVKQLGT